MVKEGFQQMPTALEEAWDSVETQGALDELISLAQKHRAQEHPEPKIYDDHIRKHLHGSIFVGHINTDLDSVAGAIGAAALFDGIPAISEENLNGEILFALKECNIEKPTFVEHIPGAKDDAFFCLVDHSEVKQMCKILQEDKNRGNRIRGVIDHHALAESLATSKPLFMDLRPWGSMSTIVTCLYMQHKKYLPPQIAKLLLMAVLSDTLNLTSVTTTDADRQVVVLLSSYGKVNDPDEMARLQFQAKTDWIVNLGAYEMVRGDQKDFSAGGWKCGIAVLEVTTVEPVLAVAESIIMELRILKKEKGENKKTGERDMRAELDFAFLFIVDIVGNTSKMIISGGRELALAKAAFPGCKLTEAQPGITAPGSTIKADETLMHLGEGMVSRKAQFAPAFLNAMSGNFTCHKKPNSERSLEELQKEAEEDMNELLYREAQKGFSHNSVSVARTSQLLNGSLGGASMALSKKRASMSGESSPQGSPKK